MNKVYLVYSEEYPRVEFVCSSYKTAEKKKSEIENTITQYYTAQGRRIVKGQGKFKIKEKELCK